MNKNTTHKVSTFKNKRVPSDLVYLIDIDCFTKKDFVKIYMLYTIICPHNSIFNKIQMIHGLPDSQEKYSFIQF